METLNELFEDTLKDVYFAENEFSRRCQNGQEGHLERPAKAFTDHAEETKGQVKRLEQIFKLLGKNRRQRCHALKGLVKEAEELMEEAKSGLFLTPD
jgi:ferritin-like metal-binding protein YciE